MPLPRLTIVTPSYNQAAYLEQTIDSVLSQNYPNLEYMILDGGSTDGSVDVIKKYSRFLKYWRSCRDSGQSAAIDEGFQQAAGDILAWINSDDYYEPDTFASIADVFMSRPDTVLVYGDYNVLYPSGKKILKPKVSCDFKIMAYAYLMIPQPAAFWTRDAYVQSGGLDSSLKYVMDLDFFLRMSLLFPASRICHIPRPLATFRVHPVSKSVACKQAFSKETAQILPRYIPIRSAWQMKLRHYFYLAKVEMRFLLERGYLPLRKDRSKA